MQTGLYSVRTQLASQVQFKTQDNLLLPGLLFEPTKKSKRILLVLHGCGSTDVFYSVAKNYYFAKELSKRGIAYFPFNNRGAHYIKSLKKTDENGEEEKLHYGTAFELIKDSIIDIEAALDYLETLGYREFYLFGHSTGANKICVYNYYQPTNRVAKYILAGGGDDTGIYYQQAGSRVKFLAYLEKARSMIKKGLGEKLVPKYISDYLFSYQSYFDVCNPDGDYNIFPFNEYLNKLKLSRKPLFREYRSIKKSTLVVYGENDEYAPGGGKMAVEILKKEKPEHTPMKFKIVTGSDHGFNGYEQELARLITDWI